MLFRSSVTHQAVEVDFGGRSFSLLGMDAHVAARLFDEAIDLAEAEPGPLADFLGREERLEGAGGHLLGHAVAGVGDGDDDVAAGRDIRVERSEERRVGKECVRPCGTRWPGYQ